MVQETMEARCEVEFPLEKRDMKLVERLGILGSFVALTRAKRRHREKKKFDRDGKWKLPPYGILKINMDGSSRGNPGLASIGEIGRDSLGSMIFLFSICKGIKTINLVEGLAILATLERAHALGWRRIIFEFDSQVLINLLSEQKVVDVSW